MKFKLEPWLGVLALSGAVVGQTLVDQSSKYVLSPGSPGFYSGNSSASVTFDQFSLMLDGKRLMIFRYARSLLSWVVKSNLVSGEFHPWRLPSIPLWRDILEKMKTIKAGGFNAVSIYLHWGITEGKRGTLNFEGHRSVTTFLDIAKEVGILVILRPGPYINAETTSGGMPGWVTNLVDASRSNGTDFTAAWKPYTAQVSKFAAPYQYPAGPVILVQSENEFGGDSVTNPWSYGHTDHMKWIQETMRGNGMTKVPTTHNDYRPQGEFATGLAKVDLYGRDGYPLGWDCSHPDLESTLIHQPKPRWKELDASLDADRQRLNPAEPLYLAEYQGGALDAWNGPGYESCYKLLNEQFANVIYKNNYAAGISLQSLYMMYGGTNWGNLAAPVVYTSYDWGAAISEDRSLTLKFHEIKLQGLFLHSTPHYHLAGRVSTGTELSSSPLIFTTHLATAAGQHLYIVRQTTNSNTARIEFTLDVKTASGSVILPELALNGRESKIFVTEYPFGSSTLRYTTAEVATWLTLDGEDHIVLYASNQTTHTILPTTSRTKPTINGVASSITASISNGAATISGTAPSGLVRVTVGKTSVWLSDKSWLAPRIWQPRVSGTSGNAIYDLSPRTGSVLVFGPYLVRNATVNGSTLAIVGDSKSGTTTDLEVLAPLSVKIVTWNGRSVKVSKTATGTLKGSIVVEDFTPKLPSLKSLEWRCIDSLPETALEFDDSTWVTANKTTTARPARFQPLGGKLMLYADEYGYHQGNVVYRGRFSGQATGVHLVVQGGSFFGYSAFLNGAFLGSGQSSSDIIGANYTFPANTVGTDNVLTVVVDNTGIDEENWEGKSKAPRGIRGYELLGGGDFFSWKLIGNVDGEDTKDTIRGPLNQGGLYVERIGALYPTYNFTSAWNSSSTDASCTPFAGINTAGVRAYKTKFSLNVNETTDLTVSFKFTRTPSSNYRAMLYVNGWQFGRFASNYGPQTVFPIPEGIINHRGENDVLLTLWSLGQSACSDQYTNILMFGFPIWRSGRADLELVSGVVLQSGKEVVKGLAAGWFARIRGTLGKFLFRVTRPHARRATIESPSHYLAMAVVICPPIRSFIFEPGGPRKFLSRLGACAMYVSGSRIDRAWWYKYQGMWPADCFTLLHEYTLARCTSLTKHAGTVKPGAYIAKLKRGFSKSSHPGRLLSKTTGSSISYRYDRAFDGYAAYLDAQALQYVRRTDEVEAIFEDGVVHIENEDTNEELGRSVHAPAPLAETSQFSKRANGSGVDVYEIGTSEGSLDLRLFQKGIYLQHSQFGGRALWGATFGGVASSALDAAVNNAISKGIHFTCAAGNSNVDAGTISPARVAAAITVGAVDANGNKASFSNYGSVVDVYYYGVNVVSAWIGSPTATNTLSGTRVAM
ncbi:hypothetical protein FRC10_008399 [Ceratobasidium sp. 414]|nr:hypothetical protein FRC10_008399 [Ceratobasidium sp. 414]